MKKLIASSLLVALVAVSSWGQEHVYVPDGGATVARTWVNATAGIGDFIGGTDDCGPHTNTQYIPELLHLQIQAGTDPRGLFEAGPSSDTVCYRGTPTITVEIFAFVDLTSISGTAGAKNVTLSLGKEQESALPMTNSDQTGGVASNYTTYAGYRFLFAVYGVTTLDTDDCIGVMGKVGGTASTPTHRVDGLQMTIEQKPT
jgi:hypothetical protein